MARAHYCGVRCIAGRGRGPGEYPARDHRACRAEWHEAAAEYKKYDCGCQRQGRGREEHGCSESCARAVGRGGAHRFARRRYLWPVPASVAGPPESKDGKTMEPLHAYGLQINSIGFLIDADQPAVWRGPMATSAFNQLLHQTKWDALDYLIIDMPPGTGDIQLTLAQRVPVTGAVIVTTPQEIALRDAKKGLRMFEKAGIPILGVIENMGAYLCRHCGHVAPIFGAGGGTQMCTQYGVPLLGSLPLDIQMREQM